MKIWKLHGFLKPSPCTLGPPQGAHEKLAVLTADSQLLKPMATLIHDECSVDINDQRFVFAAWPHKMGQFHCENDDEQ